MSKDIQEITSNASNDLFDSVAPMDKSIKIAPEERHEENENKENKDNFN